MFRSIVGIAALVASIVGCSSDSSDSPTLTSVPAESAPTTSPEATAATVEEETLDAGRQLGTVAPSSDSPSSTEGDPDSTSAPDTSAPETTAPDATASETTAPTTTAATTTPPDVSTVP